MKAITTTIFRLSFAIAILVIISIEANAMASIFGSKTLFSELNGTVVIGGKPCIGARLLQSVSDGGGEEINVETTTDSDGKFNFPEISKNKGILSLLPGEFVAAQQLLIQYEGREYEGWISTKRNSEANSEANGLPFQLVCELEKKAEYGEDHFGVCRLISSTSTN
jgi:hypothetical protein